MRIAIAGTCPAFDAREQAFNPRPVALDHILVAQLLVINQLPLPVTNPATIGVLLEGRYKIFCAREDENIRFLSVAVLR